MRASILSFLACASFACASHCNIAQLAAETSCGCSKAITSCLQSATLSSLPAIEKCYVEAGCSEADALVEAKWFAHDCNADWATLDREDLRKRQDTDTATDTPTATAAKPTKATTTSAKKTTATSAAPSTTAAPTTSTTSDEPTSTSTSAALTSTTSDSATVASTITAASVTTPLVCSITKTVSTTACSVSAGKTVTCTPTTTPIASCAPGVICFKANKEGKDVCMKKDNTLTLSGMIVAIVFGVGIIGALIVIVALAVRNRRKNKRDEQAAAMMKSKRIPVETSSVPFGGRGAGPDQSEDHLPLMPPSEHTQGQTQAPKLHQGLGGLGGDPSPRY